MYFEHPTFTQPIDTTKVWRYMDFAKFVSLLESRSLFFTRPDKFEDPFEGSYPKLNEGSGHLLSAPPGLSYQEATAYQKLVKDYPSQVSQHIVKMVGVNCWHMNDHESAAMWSLYLKNSNGVAVQSDYEKLRGAFSATPENVFIGEVRYIDYKLKHFEGDENVLGPLTHKRKSFEHEKEIRAMIFRCPPIIEGGKWDLSANVFESGGLIQVDLNELIERIYVAPSSPAWFVELVKNVMARYELGVEVQHSQMDEASLW